MKYRILRVAYGCCVLFGIWLRGLLMGSLGLSKLHHFFIERLVKKTGLFDSEYYLTHHSASKDFDNDGLSHFVAIGDSQGLYPSPLFDPSYYRSGVSHLPFFSTVNSILHYVLIGRYMGKSPGSHFDLNYYLAANPDVASSGMDPLLHFLHFGGKEGRNPSRYFDSARYLSDHPEVARRGQNPLVHYLLPMHWGEDLNNSQLRVRGAVPALDYPGLPPCSEWAHLLGIPTMTQPPLVDVIVPVYQNKVLTLRCVYSVLRAKQNTPFELIVINDASPDEELVCCLRELAHQDLITLLEHEDNQGYVYSANRGMKLHPALFGFANLVLARRWLCTADGQIAP